MEEHSSRRNRPSAVGIRSGVPEIAPVRAHLARVLERLPRISRHAVIGVSMFPTLAPSDRLLVLRPALGVRTGDLVLARSPTAPNLEVVKRVAAIVGPRGRRRYILLGDNPAASTDSRAFGSVSRHALSGRVLLRYWPDARRGRVR